MYYPLGYKSSNDGYYTGKLSHIRSGMAQTGNDADGPGFLGSVGALIGLWLIDRMFSGDGVVYDSTPTWRCVDGKWGFFSNDDVRKAEERKRKAELEAWRYEPLTPHPYASVAQVDNHSEEERRRKAELEAMRKRQKEEPEHQLAQGQAAEKARKEAAAKKAQKEREEAERKARQLVQKQASEKARKEALEMKEQKKTYSRNENLTAFANPCGAMLRRFPVGAKVSGRVQSIKEYGAFVELAPGIAGLVHNSELSWTNSGAHASEVFNIGDEVLVVVSMVNWNGEKKKVDIALSVRQAQVNPWPEIVAKYAVGSVIRGKVFKILMYGAVVALEDGVCGFVHISKISDRYIDNVGSELSVGQEIEACVIGADVVKRRIELSIRDVSMPKCQDSTLLVECKTMGAHSDIRMEKNYIRSVRRVKLNVAEGRTVEFKKSLVFSPKTNSPGPDQVTNIAKEIAAFMNTDGGDLYLGVNDDGYVVGVSNDFNELNAVAIDGYHGSDRGYDPYKPTRDGYILKITNLVKFMLGKLAATLTNVEFASINGAEYVKIHVKPMVGRNMAYFGENQDLYVRNNSSVLKLVGAARDDYRDARIAKSCGG